MNISCYSEFINENNKLKIKQSFFYTPDWEVYLPDKLDIIYDKETLKFTKGNVMLLGDLIEITYNENSWGNPETLEFDLYFVKDTKSNKLKIDIDITFGDFMACEFSITPPNLVEVIQHTTYHSKFDTTNTVFALDDKSLDEFIEFLNILPDVKLTRHDLRFLDKYDNYIQ